MSIPLTPEFIDDVLTKMDSALEYVLKSQSRQLVQLPGAELDLLKQIELARDFMDAAIRKGDRQNLLAIFGGDCSRVSHIRAVLESTSFSEMNAGDQRLRTCLEACESVEKVLADIGFEPALSEAQQKERASLIDRRHHATHEEFARPDVEGDSEVADSIVKQADDVDREVSSSSQVAGIPPAAAAQAAAPADEQAELDACEMSALQASHVENTAIQLDREGKVREALERYEDCEKLLAAAISVALPSHELDHPVLIQHRDEVLTRMTYLRSLAEGQLPALPPEEHIHAVQLAMCVPPGESTSSLDMDSTNGGTLAESSAHSVAKYVALGAVGAAVLSTGGFVVLGGAYMAAGASAAAGVATAGFCAARPDAVDSAAQQAGSAASDTAEKAVQLSKQAGSAANETAGKAKQLVEDLGSKLTSAGAAAATKAAQVSGTSSESAKHFGSKLISGLTDASLMISNAASGGSQKAKELSRGITTKLTDTGTSVSETAAKVTASGAESAAKIGDAIFDRLAFSSPATKASSDESAPSGAAAAGSARGSWLPSNLNLGISSAVSKAMGSTSAQVDGTTTNPEHTTAAEATHELRVEVLAASDLGGAEYRMGDTASSLLSVAVASNPAVYVELQLGGRRVSTAPAATSATGSGRRVTFVGERHLFAYCGEHELTLCVREQRKLQSMMRGDPPIGDGRVSLGTDISDCQPRSAEVEIRCNGSSVGAGTVALRYQLLPVPGQEVRTTLATRAMPEQEGDVEFRTPPGSPHH